MPAVPGRSSSGPLRYVGAVAALIGLFGYVVLGWRFGADDGPIPVAVAAVCVAIALASTVYRRR